MKKVDYIIIAVCVLFIATYTLLGIYIDHARTKNAVDQYHVSQIRLQEQHDRHLTDSISRQLRAANAAIIARYTAIIAQRDSLDSIAIHSLTHIQSNYVQKTAHLAQLPDDSVLLIFAGQLSAPAGSR